MRALLEAIKGDPALKQPLIKAVDRGRRADRQAAVRIPQLGPAASAPLEHDLERSRLRHRLFHPHGGGQVEHPGQLAERDEIFLSGPRCERRAAQRRQPLHRHLREGQTPPVNGFWSLTLYNEHHFFAPNEIKRYSIGTKNKALKYQSRRLADDLRAGRRAACRATRQLAAGAEGRRLHALRPRLLAEGARSWTARGRRRR